MHAGFYGCNAGLLCIVIQRRKVLGFQKELEFEKCLRRFLSTKTIVSIFQGLQMSQYWCLTWSSTDNYVKWISWNPDHCNASFLYSLSVVQLRDVWLVRRHRRCKLRVLWFCTKWFCNAWYWPVCLNVLCIRTNSFTNFDVIQSSI